MFRKKILIIGDSNCLPKYNFDKKNQIILENTYLYRLKKKFHKFDFEQVTIGGITTLELINHAISYYGSWRPDVLIMHTGINDIKGTRIFEGDIVRQKIGRKYEYYPVTWECYGWYIDNFPLAMFDEDLLVVGNIHHQLKKTKK